MHVLAEVIATPGDLRSRVNPKYRFDERMHDLTQCLLLDGYIVTNKTLIKGDPSITSAPPIEDDLILALQNSGLLAKTILLRGLMIRPLRFVRRRLISMLLL